MAFFLTLFLTSCRTKTVTQDRYITDTSVSKGLDQIWQERFVAAFEQMAKVKTQEKESSLRETRHTKDSTSTTVDATGKPIKTESWHEVISNKESREVTRLQDSLYVVNKMVDRQQSLILQKDSLIRLKQDSIQVLSRELTKNEQRYMTLGKLAMWAIICLVLVIVAIAVWRWHRKKFANENNYN
jgi:hypothetical protein